MAVGGYLRGERAAVAIPLAILAFIALTEIYHRYRRRTSPPEGPPDPSYDWDRDLKEPDRSPVQVFRYDKATLAALLVGMALYPLLPAAFYIVSIPHPTGIGLLACILAGVLPTLGTLTLFNRVSSRGADPCHLSVDKSGKWLFVANYSGGSVAAFPVQDDGKLGEASAFFQHAGSSVNKARQSGPHGHAVVVSPDNRFVLAADLGLDRCSPTGWTRRRAGSRRATRRFRRLRRGRARAIWTSGPTESSPTC